MIAHFEASLSSLSVHRVGNRMLDEHIILSEQPVYIQDELLNHLLLQYFLGSYEKVNEVYHFYHPGDKLEMNEVFHYASGIFEDQNSFHENSRQIARHFV